MTIAAWPAVSESLDGSMRRCYGDAPVTRLLNDIGAIYSELAAAGFTPEAPLSGGLASIVVTGGFEGRPAVAKLSPSSFVLNVQVDAIDHWGPTIAPEVLARGDRWAVFEHGGVSCGRPIPADMWDVQLDVFDAIAARPDIAAHKFDTALSRSLRLRDLALGRPACVEFHGDSGLEALEVTVDELLELGAVFGSTVLHGDPHDGNWVTSERGLRVIDPDPFVGPIAADVARWLIAGGADDMEARARAAIARGYDLETGLWLRFHARERAGALVHHGRSHEWGSRLISTAERVSRLFR